MISYDVMVRTQSTPNPHAIKFVANCAVKLSGKATFSNSEEADKLPLARGLFLVSGVEQLHMFENIITVTFRDDIDIIKLKEDIISVLQSRLPIHDPNFLLETEKKKKKTHQSPEIQKIEEILDRTIRPGLQADGGDIEVVALKDKNLVVSYQGACGSCPSAMYGTLDAIHSILRAEYDPDLEITIE